MIKTWFPKNVDSARLERDAERHAFELDFDRDRIDRARIKTVHAALVQPIEK